MMIVQTPKFSISLCCVLTFLCFGTGFSQPRINEVCPSNDEAYNFLDLGYVDWIEIHNPTASVVELDDYYLTNDSLVLNKWAFPDMDLDAGSYQLFPAIENHEADSIIDFNLSRTTDYLLLTDGSSILQSVSWEEIRTDHSKGFKSDQFFYFQEPTPEFENTSTAYKGYAQQPELSISSRQLFTSTSLSISAPAAHEIYYFKNGHLAESPFSYSNSIPLKQTTTIAAYCQSDSLIDSRLVYGTYFFGSSHNLPVIHLQLDSLALLDDSTGIYSQGYDHETEFPYFGANFWKDTAITAYFEYFDQDMNLRTSLECDLKIHGGSSSRTKPMKPLRLLGKKKYDQDHFEHDFFENKDIDQYQQLILRNSGSDFNRTHLLDAVFHSFAIDIGLNIDVQAYEPVVVYINGYYWGVHNLRERTNAAYLVDNYGISEEGINILEEEELWVVEGDSLEFKAIADFITTVDMSLTANFELADAQLDTRSMVDYFIFETYLNNRDWPYNNLKLWNSEALPRYRYFLNDLDAACKYYGSEVLDYHFLEDLMGSWGDANIHVRVLRSLLENAEFKRYFVNRYADLLNTFFERDYILDYIQQSKAILEPEMEKHFDRWSWPPYANWDTNFDRFDQFFADRVAIVREELSAVFDLPESTPVYLGIYPSNAGTINCNTLELEDFPFVGDYYSSNSIDLTAKAENNAFLYWKNLRTGEETQSASIQIDPQAGDSLIAVFAEPKASFELQIQPNPITDQGIISYSLSEPGFVQILVHDLSGRRVQGFEYDYKAFGAYTTQLDFNALLPGEYILSIHSPQGKEGLKFVKQ